MTNASSAERGTVLGRTVQSVNAPVRQLAQLLLERDGPYAQAFENLILALIVLSLVSVGLETLSGLPAWATRVLKIGEIVVVAVFSFEYLLRIVAAPRKLAFIFSFYGLVDLLAIAPFYLAGLDARYLRALRVLRVLRVLKLQRRVLEKIVAERTHELAERNNALIQAQAQLKAELDIALALQIAILPSKFPAKSGCDGAARMVPATTMGGDFYDFIELPDGQVGLVMADVSGKGTSAALYMAELKGLVLSLSRIHDSPARLLSEANRILAATLDPRSFITMTYAIVDTATQTMRYARAGHNPMIHLEADTGRTRVLTPAGLGLGIDEGARFDEILEEAEVPLRGGDLFLFFTDGLSEAMNGRAELFGERRLRDVIESAGNVGEEASALKDRILTAIRTFVGDAAQNDDMTMVILKVV